MNKTPVNQIALVLSQENPASVPDLIYKGSGELARQIICIAKRYNIPVRKQAKLAQALNSIPDEENIPIELLPALKLILDEVADCRKGRSN